MKENIENLEVVFLEIEDYSSKENLNKLFRSICVFLSLNGNKPQASLFDPANSMAAKEFVASCFLRIFDSCHEVIWEDKTLRLKVITLLDSVYSDRVYRVIKIGEKEESHKKFSIFQSVKTNFLADIEKIKNSITSLETALKVRNSYMKLISSPVSEVFLKNHIHDQSLISKERLSEFFNTLEQYSQASRKQKLTAYSKLKEVLRIYDAVLKEHVENIFFKKIIFEMIYAFFDAATHDFDASGLKNPAVLVVNAVKRKYPLHLIGNTFQIKFNLSNAGPGVAFDSRVDILESSSEIEIETEEIVIGDIDVGENELIVRARSIEAVNDNPLLIGVVSWADYKGEREEKDFEVEMVPQNGTVDWDKIKYHQPYSLESVDSEAELVGRKDLLENISSKLMLKKGESSIIYGQKRVGKTSLARTIQSRFENKGDSVTIFIEAGSLDKSSPDKFIKSLGEKIIKRLKRLINTSNLVEQEFDGSLHPLVSFVEDVISINQDLRIIIILDEFDEIPSKLYPYTEAGDSLFHNLRSLSGESGEGRVTLILVGGENMSDIMQSTDKLNKFDAWNVGYFDKSESWEDFRELVKAPVKDTIEYSDEAVVSLYNMTEGNPFYTKMIAKNLYKKMCDKHCSYISADEIGEAIRDTVLNMEAINVIHFWSDRIRVEDSEKRDLIETQRRRFLISFSEIMRSNKSVSKRDLLDDKSMSQLPVKEIIDSFISRNILREESGSLHLKPKLFEKWLVEKGVHTLRASFSDEDALMAYNEKESEAYITDSEIIEMVGRWELYRGMEVSASKVRCWLNQFDDNMERRLAFKLLGKIDFYGELKIREKLKVIHEKVRSQIVHAVKQGERVRKDVLISSFGTVSKSGSSYVRMYAVENGITSHNVKNNSDVEKFVKANTSIKSIVFIDDMVASGKTIEGELEAINEGYGELLKERNILVIVGVICGFSKGIDLVESKMSKLQFNAQLKVCDLITEDDRAFSDDSNTFSDSDERSKALSLARKYGSKLQKTHPLGFNNSQLLIVFKDNCPNNTLPIFWDTSNNPKWTPLFKRS